MTTTPPTLIHLSYSPWSDRARWALDARGIEVRSQHYQPLIGELGLRRTLGRWRGAVSVPVLLTADGPIADSIAIARWADGRGDGPTLFPDDAAVERWNARADDALSAGRALALPRVARDPEALDELTPKPLRALGAPIRVITKLGVERTHRKYGGHLGDAAEHEATLVGVLDAMRDALGGDPEARLLGAMSYADITCAQVLAFVAPHDGPYLKLGAASRRVYGDAGLAERYADLVAWRDALYATRAVR